MKIVDKNIKHLCICRWFNLRLVPVDPVPDPDATTLDLRVVGEFKDL